MHNREISLVFVDIGQSIVCISCVRYPLSVFFCFNTELRFIKICVIGTHVQNAKLVHGPSSSHPSAQSKIGSVSQNTDNISCDREENETIPIHLFDKINRMLNAGNPEVRFRIIKVR